MVGMKVVGSDIYIGYIILTSQIPDYGECELEPLQKIPKVNSCKNMKLAKMVGRGRKTSYQNFV